MAVLQLADVVKASNGIVLTRLYDGSRDAYVSVETIVDALESQMNLRGELRAAMDTLVRAARAEADSAPPISLASGPSTPARAAAANPWAPPDRSTFAPTLRR